MNELDWLRISATEMDGANILDNGDIHAHQTLCHVLNYIETLPRSLGSIEGEQACLAAIEEWLAANGFESLEDYYMLINGNVDDRNQSKQ